MDIALALNFLLNLLSRSEAIGNLIKRFQEGNMTQAEFDAELDVLAGADDVARAALVEAIAKRKAEGG